jgi:hypothetical protein
MMMTSIVYSDVPKGDFVHSSASRQVSKKIAEWGWAGSKKAWQAAAMASRAKVAVALLVAAHVGACVREDAGGAPGLQTPDPEMQTPSPADEPGASQSVTFFVELLHLPTFRFLDSGAADPQAEEGAVEFSFEAPRDARVQWVLVPDPPDGTFTAFQEEGLSLFDGDELVGGDRGGQLKRFELSAEDAGELHVLELGTDGSLGTVDIEQTSEDVYALRALPNGPHARGVYTVHRRGERMFSVGKVVAPEFARWVLDGEALAYVELVEEQTGFSSLVAPGLFVVHQEGEPLFTPGELDRGQGLERLAEDGDPFPLLEVLREMFDGIAPFPEARDAYLDPAATEKESTSYSLVVAAAPGDRLSLAAMLAQTNDTFIGTAAMGLPLFRDGQPVSGDLTNALTLWEVGTELNERAGYGQHQAARQTEPNSGPTENRPIGDVSSDFPPVARLVRLTISPAQR